MKKKLCLVLAAVMLFTGVYINTATAETAADSATDTVSAIPSAAELQSYTEYTSQNSGYSPATEEIVVDAVSYRTSQGAKIEKVASFEGKTGVLKWTNEEGSVTYDVNVPSDGLYTVNFVYYCLPSRNNPISLGLKVDGKYLFEGCKEFELPRVYVDDGDVRVDGIGNEFSAAQKETYMFQENYFKDPTGLESAPYALALSKGTHTFEIESVAEPVALDCFVLAVPETYADYSTVSASYDSSKNASMSEPIIIEGEDAVYKSNNSLVAQYDQTDPSVSSKNGSNPYLTRINYIGNSNWSSPGERLTWKFEVPESGYYKLAFRYQQNQVLNGNSYRTLLIDGKVPFDEATRIKFPYGLNWNFMEFGSADGNPYLVYLEAGEHELSMEVSLGELTDLVRELKDVVYDVGLLYRKIVMITGETPDYNRDYELFNQIPNFLEDLEAYRTELERIASETERLAGQAGGTNASTIRSLTAAMKSMIDNKYMAHQYKSLYYTNYTSVSALVYSMMEMALNLDYIAIAAPDYAFENPAAGWFTKTAYSFQRFLSSFSADYNNISGDVETEQSITIWANWGRDQIRVLNNLIQSSFTPQTGIGVNLKMSNASYVQAILSGKGPDCSLQMARSEPVNLALRGAMYDLKQFDDFGQVMDRFMTKDSAVPFTFQDGVYALPDTINFYMMFYRTDLFEEYGLEPPKTWDEFVEVSSILYRNNLQASLPYTQITTAAMVNAGVGSLSILPTLIMQMGGQIYKEDGSATDLTSATSIRAFEFWTDFFAEYKFPVTADFFNRFRIGTMPLGIQNYTMYINLTLAAPEITGKWKMVPIPGFEQEDGSIRNVQAGSGTGCGILKVAKNKEAGWEFLKWWTSADTQLGYSNNCESILGVAGRVATSNPEALKQMAWDKDSLQNLLSQWSMLQEVPEVPGSYYTARSIDQAYWNVVNNSKNAKDMLIKWADIANNEIARKRKQYNVE